MTSSHEWQLSTAVTLSASVSSAAANTAAAPAVAIWAVPAAAAVAAATATVVPFALQSISSPSALVVPVEAAKSVILSAADI